MTSISDHRTSGDKTLTPPDGPIRNVVLGRSSKVWAALAGHAGVARLMEHAISHKDLDSFVFTHADRVWVFSYSRLPNENDSIFQRLRAAGVGEVIYVSSSSTIVNRQTECYEYPRVKQLAENSVLGLPTARILTIGLMYSDATELPAGENIATSYNELAEFMLSPQWPQDGSRRQTLFRRVSRPFGGPAEAALFNFYSMAMKALGSRPCLLRPVDLLLRTMKMRWYGYVFLSNRLWISTML